MRGRKCEWQAAVCVCVGTAGHFKRACHPLNNVSVESLSLAGILHFKKSLSELAGLGGGEGPSVSAGMGVLLWHRGAGLRLPASGARLLRSDIKTPFRWCHCATLGAEGCWPLGAAGPGGGRVAPHLGRKPQLPLAFLSSLCLPPSQGKRGNKEGKRWITGEKALEQASLVPPRSPCWLPGSAREGWGEVSLAPTALGDPFPGAPR